MTISSRTSRNVATAAIVAGGLLSVWLLRGALIPLLLAVAGAFLLEPLAHFFERRGRSRLWALAVAAAGLLAIAAVVVLLLIPSLAAEVEIMRERLPGYEEVWAKYAMPRLALLTRNHPELARELPERARALIREHGAEIGAKALTAVESGLGSLVGILMTILTLLVAPVFLFYLVSDGRELVEEFLELIPPANRPLVDSILSDINRSLRGYLKGQLVVCATLGSIYAAGLFALGIPFALGIAVLSGLANFVPYLGIATGLTSALVLTFLEYQFSWRLIAVAGVFVLAQAIEGMFVTPRVVAKSLGLHPVVVLVALLVWGELFGFLGVLLALPATAVFVVLYRRARDAWKSSATWRGIDG